MIISMSHPIANIIANLQQIIEHGGYTILFVTTVLEGIPIVGSLVPGHTVVILSGLLAKLGILNLGFVLALVTIAALLGDIIGFMLGKKYGITLLTRFSKYLFIKDEYIEKAKKIIND